jgi:hypothetical protein
MALIAASSEGLDSTSAHCYLASGNLTLTLMHLAPYSSIMFHGVSLTPMPPTVYARCNLIRTLYG